MFRSQRTFPRHGLLWILFLAASTVHALELSVSTLKTHLRPAEGTELQLTLANDGGVTRTNLTVDFEMPGGFRGNTAQTDPTPARGFTNLPAGELVGWDVPLLAPGQIVHLRLVVVAESGLAALPDGASATFNFVAADDGEEVDSAALDLTIDSAHTLDAAFSLETTGAEANVPFEVVLVYGNRGLLPQSNLVLTLEIPPDVTAVDASEAPGGSGSTLTWSRGTLNPGGVGQVRVRLQWTGSPSPGQLATLALTAATATQTQGCNAILTPGTVGDLQLVLDHNSFPLNEAQDAAQFRVVATNNQSFARSNLVIRWLRPDRITGDATWSDEAMSAGFTDLSLGEVAGWTFSQIGAREARQARFQLWPDTGQPAGTVIPFSVLGRDDSGGQAVALVAIAVQDTPALDVEVTSADLPLVPGTDFCLTLALGNRSATPLNNLSTQLVLPGGMIEDLQIAGGGGSFSGDLLSLDPINLGPGSVARRILVGRFKSNPDANTAAPQGLAKQISALVTDPSGSQSAALSSLSWVVQDAPTIELALSLDRNAVVSPNDGMHLRLTVKNPNDFPISDLDLDLLIPRGLVGSTASATPTPDRGFTNLTPAEVVGWDIASLAPGAVAFFEMALNPNGSMASGAETRLAARIRNASYTLLDDAQLTLSTLENRPPSLLLSAEALPVAAGETVALAVTYGNPTTSPLLETDLVVELPRGLTYLFGEDGVTRTPDPSYPSEGGGTLTILSDTLVAVGTVREAIFYAQVASTGVPDLLPLKAVLTSSGGMAASTLQLPVSSASKLRVAVSEDGNAITGDLSSEYVVAVTNRGITDLSDVQTRLLFPATSTGNTTWTSPTTDVGFTTLVESEVVGWDVGILPAGATRFFRFKLGEAGGDGAVNGAIATLAAYAGDVDGSQATGQTRVFFHDTSPLDLTLTAGPHAVLPGEAIDLQLSLGNRSASLLGTTAVRVDLPGDLLEVLTPVSDPPLVGNAMRWTRASLAPGEGATAALTVRWRTGVPAGTQAKISARAENTAASATASVVLVATTTFQAELVPLLSATRSALIDADDFDLILQPDNTSVFQRINLTADFFTPEGFTGSVNNATPAVSLGFTNLNQNERIGWTFATYAAGASTILTQPVTFAQDARTPAGSIIPLTMGVIDDSLGNNLASLTFRVGLSAVALTAVNPLGSDPTDLDGDGIPDRFESNTGLFLSDYDTGTDPNNPDSDGDGILDGRELASGFLDPNRDDSFIVDFFAARTRDLAFGSEVIRFDVAPGNFILQVGLLESIDLSDFVPRLLSPAEVSVMDGNLQLQLPTSDDTYFYRFFGSPLDR